MVASPKVCVSSKYRKNFIWVRLPTANIILNNYEQRIIELEKKAIKKYQDEFPDDVLKYDIEK